MKKRKFIAFLFIIAFGLIFSPLFFACENFEIILNTPTSFAYQIDEETGKQLLVVEANKYASGYLFGIGTSYDGESTDNFLRYEVTATTTVNYDGREIEIDQNYFDVTNIFKNTKTYYYYVQYKGDSTYKDSKISEVKSVTITSKLETPRLSYLAGKLSWTAVDNANTYTVYASTDSWKEVVDNDVDATEYNIASYINEKLSNGLSSEIRFFVYANTYQNYIRSSDSNIVTYSAHLYLQTPANFAVKKTGEALTWSPVQNAETYTLKVNNLQEIVIGESDYTMSGNKIVYDATNIYQYYGLGDYEFRIKTNGHGQFISSSYSSVVTDRYSQKLETPQNIRCVEGYDDSIEIMWNNVQFANVYILKFTDKSNGNVLKEFKPNDSNGIPQDITYNSITLSYEELGISSVIELNTSSFIITVQAKGYNYYDDSDFSTGKTVVSKSSILNAPTIVDDSSTSTIDWNVVIGAVGYKIAVEFNQTIQYFTTTNTYFDYADIFTNAGEYKVSVYSLALNEIYNSIYSNQITITINDVLETPEITDVVMNGDYFVVSFDADSKSQSQTLYVNNNLITTNFLESNPRVLASEVIGYAENDILRFQIKSNSVSFWNESAISNSFEFSIKLSAPTIQISGNTLSWNSVNNATNYVLLLDDVEYDLNSANTSLNLTNYVDLNNARQVAVIAKNIYLEDSDISATKIYNRVQTNLNNYTNKFFYYGETYDYYITDADELYALVEYSFFNFLPKISGYMSNYDDTARISQRVDEALEKISATQSFSYSMTNPNGYSGEFVVTMNHKQISSAPTYTASTTQYSGGMVYCGNGTRTTDHVFASDNYIVSQDVYTTDGLLSAIENRAKPNFVGNSNLPQQIYQIAKDILVEIIDDTMTDFEKALAIHDYIGTNISYDYYGREHVNKNQYLGYFHYMESALLYNLGVCDAYAKTYSLLCNMEGIKCIVVNGLTDKSNSDTGHSWNKIYLDHDNNGTKDWFVVDCTYDDVKSTYNNVAYEFLTHDHFLISDYLLFQVGEPDTSGVIKYRQEDEGTSYPATTISAEGFYSIYSYKGYPIKVTTVQSAQQLNNYILTHQNEKIEVLIHKNDVYRISHKTGFYYSFDSNYYILYTN